MRKASILLSIPLVVLWASTAAAWHVEGFVACDANHSGQLDAGDILAPGVPIRVTSASGPFVGTTSTDGSGHYLVELPNTPDSYSVVIDEALPSGTSFVLPPSGVYSIATTDTDNLLVRNFLVFNASCATPPPPPPPPLLGKCWMTAGGVKFDPDAGSLVAENGPSDSFGGNVFPSCSPLPGNGGNWNHISHSQKLHFQGKNIQQVLCGNVPGIPPGSTSPATGFNFILFGGDGTLQGIDGNTANFGKVFFVGYVEDRNEPGNSNANGANGGQFVDRYWLYVFSNPADITHSGLFLVNGDPTLTFNPVTITGGNIQLHASSCDNPPVP
jgi:hypothetical protein